MILRLTAKLGSKIGARPEQCLSLSMNPFLDWVGHLFTAERTQYIILSNTVSLYSIIMYGRGITDDNEFIGQSMSNMRELMASDGLEFIFHRLIAPSAGRIRYSKVRDRKVLGSIAELVREARFYIVERDASPFDAASQVNQIPLSYLRYKHPKEVFAQLRPPISFGR
jgi:hypothetical protein